jgi:glycosyltransferase involved in cell wall biosynthesis
MKKIALYIDSDFQGSGVSQYIKALLNSLTTLSSNDIVLTVIYTRKCWDSQLAKTPYIKSVFLKNSKYINRFYQLLISFGLYFLAKLIAQNFDKNIRYIDNQNFDYVMFPSADTIACLVESRVIGTIHDLMHRYERQFKECGAFLRFHYRDNYYRKLLLSSKAVFVDSNLGKQQVLESYSKVNSEILVLPFIAPDYIYYHEVTKPDLPIHKELSNKYLFYAAVFFPHKNHLNLIKAIKLLKERGHLINLLLAGKKNREYNMLNRFVIKNGLQEQVRFLGYVPDLEMINLYRNAFAMVMPSFIGPTNIPPIEAILLNCPPIVSNVYGMPEQFEDAALYFDPHSSSQIADSIESLLTDNELRDNLIQNGIKIRDKFSQKRFECDLKNILQNLS